MKRLIIIGGSGGLGAPLSEYFTRHYVVTSLSSQDVNVTDILDVMDVITHHDPDLVLNMAARSIDGLLTKELSSEDAQYQIEVNAVGAYNVINACCNHWRNKNKSGKLVLMSSFLSDHPTKGAGVYCATKSFVDSIAQTAALENARYGITVNSVRAGFFNGGLTDKLPPKIKDALPSRIPVGRIGYIEELAHALKFLFENDYVTGTNLVIDGGVGLV